MANALKKVIPQCQVCPVCLDTFIDPRILSCSHTYCKTCLDYLLEYHGNDQMLRCPVCRAKTQVPNQDVSKLPTNLASDSSIEDMIYQYQFGTNCKSEEKPQAGVYSQDCDDTDINEGNDGQLTSLKHDSGSRRGDISFGDLLIPPDITRTRALRAYAEAADASKKKVFRIRLMPVGQERVGKTSQGIDGNEAISDGIETTNASEICMEISKAREKMWSTHKKGHGNENSKEDECIEALADKISTRLTVFPQQDQDSFEPCDRGLNLEEADYSMLQHLDIIEYLCTMGARSCCQHRDEPLAHFRDSQNKDYGMLKTIETTPLDFTEYLCTVGARSCCQHHDEPLLHSRNSQNKEYDQSEDRKRSMNTDSRNLRLQFGDALSHERCIEFQMEEQQRQDMIHSIHLQRTKLLASMTVAHQLNAASRIKDLPCLQIDFFADKGKNKFKVFLSQGLQGYHTFPCNGTQRSNRFHSKSLLISMAFNSAGLRQRSRDSHIEGLHRSETLHSAGSRQSDRSHSYRSEALPRSKDFNFAGQPTFDDSHSYKTEGSHRSNTLQDEDKMRSKTFLYESLQTSDELYSHSFNDSTYPPFQGTRGVNLVLQNALQALILQISLLLRLAGKYRHVVILMIFLTQAACEGVQVPINCTSAAVITSPNYPSPYEELENIEWSVTAPEGRMLLLTFNYFSLGSFGDVKVIDNVIGRKRQRYGGEEKTFPPFLSRRNSLRLRFTSDGIPTRNGFNISASCFELSGTRVGRLMGGNTPAEGFLELQAESGGEWMRVCEEDSADRVAEVVCGELGFPGVHEVSYKEGGCPSNGANRHCIRAPSCGDYAYRSQDCSSSEKCTSSLAAAAVKVKCFEPGFKGCYDLGNTQLQNGSSYESTSQCVTSCRGNTSQAIAIINGSKCFCSTTDDIELSSFSRVEGKSCALHQLVYNASFGFCNLPKDVMNGSWDYDTTWFGSFVNLTCNQGYWLNGSGTLQCVTEVSSYLPVWTGSIPTCEMITDTSPSMTDVQVNAAIAISSSLAALLICIIFAVVRDHILTGME